MILPTNKIEQMISSSGILVLKLETKSNIINHKELQQVDGITQEIKCKCNNLSKRGMTENFKKMFTGLQEILIE